MHTYQPLRPSDISADDDIALYTDDPSALRHYLRKVHAANVTDSFGATFLPREIPAGHVICPIGGSNGQLEEDPLTQSNQHVVLDYLNGTYNADGDVEAYIHRQAYFVGGYNEFIIAPATLSAMRLLGELVDALQDYPVLDEEDFCEREEVYASAYFAEYIFPDLLEPHEETASLPSVLIEELQYLTLAILTYGDSNYVAHSPDSLYGEGNNPDNWSDSNVQATFDRACFIIRCAHAHSVLHLPGQGVLNV